MTELVIIRGMPGSGKSTLAKKFAGFTHIEPDMYHIDADGVYRFKEHEVRYAKQWAYTSVKCLLQSGQNTVISGVFNLLKSIERYKGLAQVLGASCTVIEVAGGFDNVHNVPTDVLKQMKADWEPLK